ncbi:hypothetical protein MJD09_08900 [bacterium]|nr:hypothetical protein [bacterium]
MATTIQDAVDKASERWIDVEGVEAVGQGDLDGKECIDIYLSVSLGDLSIVIPATFDGFPVVVKESGRIVAQ